MREQPPLETIMKRLTELREQHRALDEDIQRFEESGAVDMLHIKRLKRRKLQLKDQIVWLENRLIPDLDA